MAEPTLEDAVRLLTDPEHVAMGRFPGASGSRMVEIRPPAVIGGLQKMGLDEDAARALAARAAESLGGTHRVRQGKMKSLRAGRFFQPYRREDELLIPHSKLRERP